MTRMRGRMPMPLDAICRLPPEGWVCSRTRDHNGPCAARCLHKDVVNGYCVNGCGRIVDGGLVVAPNAGYAPYEPMPMTHACLLCANVFPTIEIRDHVFTCVASFQKELAIEAEKQRKAVGFWARLKRRFFSKKSSIDIVKLGEMAEANARAHAREPRNS